MGPLAFVAVQGIFPKWSSWTDDLGFAEIEAQRFQSLGNSLSTIAGTMQEYNN
jgi:hypothetical protein